MPRLIDADALLDKLKIRDLPIRLTWEIQNAPTIDAIPVVRCRECKHYKPSRYNGSTAHYCGVIDGFPKEDWFCADGQRREEGDNGKHL